MCVVNVGITTHCCDILLGQAHRITNTADPTHINLLETVPSADLLKSYLYVNCNAWM